MNLNLIPQRGTRLLVPARSPQVRYHHSGHHGQCWPMSAHKTLLADLRKSRFGKKFESYHQNRNVYKIHIDLGIWILNHRFESYRQNRKQDKIQMPNMNLNLISQRGTRLVVSSRPPSIALPSLWSPWARLTNERPQKNIGRSEKSHDLARNLNLIARTGTEIRCKSI